MVAEQVSRWLGQDGPTPDVPKAFETVSDLYSQAIAPAKPVSITAKTANDLRDAADLSRVNRYIPEDGGVVDPVALKDVGETIRRAASGARSKERENLLDASDMVSDLMDKAGFDKQIKKQADKLYGRIMTLAERNVVQEAGEEAGDIALGPLRNAIRKGKATKRASQKGLLDKDTKELTDVVSDILKGRKEQRTSTTPERIGVDLLGPLLLGGSTNPALGAAAFAAPGLLAPGLLGRAAGDAAQAGIARGAGATARGLTDEVAPESDYTRDPHGTLRIRIR